MVRSDLHARLLLRARFIALPALISIGAGGCSMLPDSMSTPAPAAVQAPRDSEVVYQQAAVAADHPLASQAGLEMLQKGGNAVDAAVATSFCLSVVRPFSCGIGGGGFMVVYVPAKGDQPAKSIAFNYRETCPAAVGPDFYSRLGAYNTGKFGWNASGVPGTVAGLCQALKQFGTLDLATVMQPAIRAAQSGFEADDAFVSAARDIAREIERQRDFGITLGPIWSEMCREGRVQVGDVLYNPAQAKALRLIARDGPAAFYEGEIALAIDKTMREHAGTLTLSDLRGYQVREVQPLVANINGRQMLSMPPPSSGGIAMQQIFGILDRRRAEMAGFEHNSADYAHLTVEAMKHAFADRSRWLADPAFAKVPVDALLESAYLNRLSASIDLRRTNPDSMAYGTTTIAEDGGTSHFCVLDKDGMAVACTETINLTFGSLLCVPGFGFCLNNEMDDFTTIRGQANAFGLRQSDANLPEPGKRPLSSMSPTIVTERGKVVLIAGGSGGPRIISATTQCILNVLTFGMTPQEAVSAPRFHHQWMPDTLLLDKRWTDRDAVDELKDRGHKIGTLDSEAVVQMIAVDEQGHIRAASDPRKGGTPAGY